MRKILGILLIAIFIFGCKSEEEKRKEAIRNESDNLIFNASSELYARKLISHDSLLKISDYYIKISLDSAELGLAYAKEFDIKAKQALSGKNLKVHSTKQSTIQSEFINQKFQLFNTDYINAGNTAIKGLYPNKTKQTTDKLLNDNNSYFSDWIGTIEDVALSYGSEKDIQLLKKGLSPKELIERYPENRDLNLLIDLGTVENNGIRYSLIGIQERNYKTGVRGVQNNDKNYDKILSLESGAKVFVTFTVIISKDFNSEIEQATTFIIKIKSIKII